MKKSLLDFDAYLFDLDGTLINTEPLHHKAWMLTINAGELPLNIVLPPV